jgi:glycosyltransferase involved in cell wall biosynthesis
MSIKISVIIPARNNGNRIAATLRYLFHQTILPTHYEIIVVDNGSTDNTEEILSRLQMESANLRWIKELEIGRAHARNRGIAESLGELVLLLDDDIEVEANHLESHLARHAQSNGPVAVIGRVVDISPITPAWVEDYFHARQVAGSPAADRENSGIPLGLYFATGNVSLLRSTLESIRINRSGESFYFYPA